jgi:hypothetical protein
MKRLFASHPIGIPVGSDQNGKGMATAGLNLLRAATVPAAAPLETGPALSSVGG